MFGKPRPQSKELQAIITGDFESLLDAKQTIDAEIAKRSAAELEAQKSRLAAMASALGVSVASMFGIRADKSEKKERRKRAGKLYRDPVTGEEWQGLGRTPPWLKERIEAGEDKDAFRVEKEATPVSATS